jgi:hypothetical protein
VPTTPGTPFSRKKRDQRLKGKMDGKARGRTRAATPRPLAGFREVLTLRENRNATPSLIEHLPDFRQEIARRQGF